MMKQQRQQMIDERTQFLQKWLISASTHQSRDCQQFLSRLLYLVSNDKRTQAIFVKNLRILLQSRQPNLHRIFQYCVQQKKKIFQIQICAFLKELFDIKNQISLSPDLEDYLVHNIWTSKMSKYVNLCNFTPVQIIQFLTLKMRSLNPQTRKSSINALSEIIQKILNGQKSPLSIEVQKILPQMIEKQIYGKQVCFYRGIFLQILQDELCQIKKRGIQLLGKAQCFFETSMIRPLILYMLNDQHQAVRQTCLIVLSHIPSFDLQKQDLSSLLICLKQNNTLMRNYTYECLSHINITSAEDFKEILEKLFLTLANYGEDKKNIFILCSKLGRKYPSFVLLNLQYIYKYSDIEQPNWKGIAYRAKLIVVANIGKDKWPKSLPKYFVNHYLYIRDVLIYAFEPKIQRNLIQTDVGAEEDMNGSSIDKKQQNKVSVYFSNDWKLYQYIQATHHSTQGFLKSLFGIISDWLTQTKMCKYISYQIIRTISLSLSKLFVMFDLESSQIAKQLIKNLLTIIEQKNLSSLRILLQKMRVDERWDKLQKIANIVFKITTVDKTRIVISNRPQILKRSFVQFSNSLHQQQLGYLRMSQVDFEQSNDKVCYYRINFKWKQLRCIILYGQQHNPQFYVSHTLFAQK